MTYEEIADTLNKNINDTYTLNLAISVLEEREDARSDNLSLEYQLTQTEKALNEIKDTLETCKKLMPHEFDWEEQADNILEKIDNVLGEEKC